MVPVESSSKPAFTGHQKALVLVRQADGPWREGGRVIGRETEDCQSAPCSRWHTEADGRTQAEAPTFRSQLHGHHHHRHPRWSLREHYSAEILPQLLLNRQPQGNT